jgi:hypothetical protein
MDYRCITCGAAPREACEMNNGGVRYESHPERLNAMHVRELFRKRVVLPTLAMGSLEISVSPPQNVKKIRIAMMIHFW